ncbi:MAG: tetratricopeptide repeat protein [Alphaproteobacteria bacterium]|nr:tetratricopeptide repeat protein [Alphaproteobacteria bacterium]
MLTLALLLAAARADDDAYATCCREAGVEPCPHNLRLVGAESQVHGELVTGLWEVSCGGEVAFQRRERAVVPEARPGAVVGVLEPGAYACFVATCPLPSAVCVDVGTDGRAVASRCTDGLPPTAVDFYAARTPHTAVVVGPREVVVAVRSDVSGGGPSAAGARTPPTRTERPPIIVAPQAPGPAPAPEPAPSPRAAPPLPATATPLPATATPLPAPPGPTAAPVARRTPPARSAFAHVQLPPAPPTPCRPRGAVRAASNDQVALGDEARVARDPAKALEHYRAALTVEPCNAFAWGAVGGVLLDARELRLAITALEHATRLAPDRALAWIDLGDARSAWGDARGAIAAYTRALELSPGDARAAEGLHRLVPAR